MRLLYCPPSCTNNAVHHPPEGYPTWGWERSQLRRQRRCRMPAAALLVLELVQKTPTPRTGLMMTPLQRCPRLGCRVWRQIPNWLVAPRSGPTQIIKKQFSALKRPEHQRTQPQRNKRSFMGCSLYTVTKHFFPRWSVCSTWEH